MENVRTQLSLFKSGEIGLLKPHLFASDNIKDYDFDKALSVVFSFITKIKDSKYINLDTDIIDCRIVKQELLGYPSILIHISDTTTKFVNEVKYSIDLDVMHRDKARFSFTYEKPFKRVNFDNIDSLIEYIKKED